MLAAASLGCATTAGGGCILFSNFDDLSGGGTGGGADGGPDADAGVDHASDGNPNCEDIIVDLCTVIPHVPDNFVQNVDGLATDFCAVPQQVLSPLQGQYRHPCPPPKFVAKGNITATLHAAWSSEALHLHVRVDKVTALTFVPHGGANLFDNDAVEIFVANTGVPSGEYASDDGIQLIVGPPAPDGGPQFDVHASCTECSFEHKETSDAKGYDVEVKIPWGNLGGPAPAGGNTILWDFRVDTADPDADAADPQGRFSAFEHYQDLDGGGVSCNFDGAYPTPSKEDRSWCISQLGEEPDH